jgi:hypothetical protein
MKLAIEKLLPKPLPWRKRTPEQRAASSLREMHEWFQDLRGRGNSNPLPAPLPTEQRHRRAISKENADHRRVQAECKAAARPRIIRGFGQRKTA